MGLFDDLAMGLGLKDRDDDYYERTARTLGRTQGAEREAAYRQSNVFQNKPSRGGPAGLLSSAFGDSSSRSQYRDINDMFDGGGPMASGGRYQGGGLLSLLANLLIGGDMGERKPYEAQGQVKISSTSGEIPKSTRDAIGALRPMLRPETNPYAVGGGFDVTAPPAMTNPYAVGGGLDVTAAPQPPAPMAQAATSVASAINPLPIQTVEAGLKAGRELEKASDDANWDAGLPMQPNTMAISDLHSEIARAQRGEPPFMLGVGQDMNVNQLSALMPPTAEGDFGFRAFVENQRQVDQLLGKTTTTEEMLERYRAMRGRY